MKRPLATLSALSFPLVLGNVTVAVNELVNRFVLGRASLSALAASLPGSMLALVFTGVFANTIGYATALVAEAHGAGDPDREWRIFTQALWTAVATVPVFALSVPAGLCLLKLAGHAPEVLRDESVYFCHSALGGLLAVFSAALGSYHAGRGRTGLPSAAALLGCLVDMAAAPVLVLGLGLGIDGAGLSKVLGALVQAAILALGVIRALRSGASPYPWRLDRVILARLLRLGLPFGLSSGVGSGTFTVFVLCLGTCGAEALAIGNLCFALNNLFNTTLCAIESAVVIMVGTCRGACDRIGMRSTFRAGVLLSLLSLFVCYTPILSCSDFIVACCLSGEATPRAHALARCFLSGLFASGIFETVKHTATGVLRGNGETDFVLGAHLAVSAGLWMPGALLLARCTRDANCLWPSIAVYTLIHAGVLAYRARAAWSDAHRP